MVLMLIVTSVYSIVDGWFISNFAGSTAFASMNIIWPAIAIISALGLMVGAGGSALVSKTFGEGDRERGNHIFTMLMRLTAVAGTVISLLLFLLMKPLALALGAEGEMVRLAVIYGRFLTAALPLYLLQIHALRRLSPFTVNVAYNLEPVYSILFAALIFGETREVGLSFWLGLILIIISVALQSRRQLA